MVAHAIERRFDAAGTIAAMGSEGVLQGEEARQIRDHRRLRRQMERLRPSRLKGPQSLGILRYSKNRRYVSLSNFLPLLSYPFLSVFLKNPTVGRRIKVFFFFFLASSPNMFSRFFVNSRYEFYPGSGNFLFFLYLLPYVFRLN